MSGAQKPAGSTTWPIRRPVSECGGRLFGAAATARKPDLARGDAARAYIDVAQEQTEWSWRIDAAGGARAAFQVGMSVPPPSLCTPSGGRSTSLAVRHCR